VSTLIHEEVEEYREYFAHTQSGFYCSLKSLIDVLLKNFLGKHSSYEIVEKWFAVRQGISKDEFNERHPFWKVMLREVVYQKEQQHRGLRKRIVYLPL
jgi:hypothetical protein